MTAGTSLTHGEVVLSLSQENLQNNLSDGDSSGLYDTSSLNVGSGYGNFSVTMTLDASKFQELVMSDTGFVFFYMDGANADIGLTTGYSTINGTKQSGIWGSWNRSTSGYQLITLNSTQSTNLSTGLDELFQTTVYDAIALTIQPTSQGTYVYMTLSQNNNVVNLAGYASGLKGSSTFNGGLQNLYYNTDYITSLVVDDTVLSQDEAISANLTALSLNVVPEPATASLSLLGLAALAMRRRRRLS